jgi:hypothetical protein
LASTVAAVPSLMPISMPPKAPLEPSIAHTLPWQPPG